MESTGAPPHPIRVLIVEDESYMADALAVVLRPPSFQVVGHLASAENLAACVRAAVPDLVLSDLNMPGPDPVDALAEIVRRLPLVRTAIISAAMTGSEIDRCVLAGVHGVFSKADAPAELRDGLLRVMAGEFVIGQEAMRETWR